MATSLEWQPSFNLGIEFADNEHKKLLQLMKSIENLNRVSGTVASKDRMLSAFDALCSATREHFEHEEKFMLETLCPSSQTHKNIHDNILEKLEGYRKEMKNSVYSKFPESVFDFFQNWLVTHILIVDKEYVPRLED